MSAQRLSAQRGFTLIELVIVIVIIGVLAAIALPKMTGMSGDARASVIKGVAGSMSAANTTIYAAAQINNAAGATGTLPTTVCSTAAGAGVATVYGYAGTVAQLAKCMTLTPATDFDVGPSAAPNEIRHNGATTPANCKVTYAPATATAAPTYTVDVSGC